MHTVFFVLLYYSILQFLEKPDSVQLLEDNKVVSNSTVLGPKDEADEVDLTCAATGGKPTPKVRWFNGTTEIKRAEYKVDAKNGVASSVLHLTLTRNDLLARFECRVESDALEEPIIHRISIDVHVRPTKIELSGVQNHVVQGTNVLLICDVHGARPPASVRWANGTIPITNQSLVQSSPEDNRDGTYTTKSSLIFKASHYENGRTFYCYSENELMRNHSEPELLDSLILDVRYPPVITVSPLNITVNESTSLSTNSTRVLLRCLYFANPQELKGIVWSKDGKNLTLGDPAKYFGGDLKNPPLYIINVTREDMGEYTCSLKNEVGSETSEDSIFLNVQFTPEVEVVMEPSTPIKAIDKTNVLLECNVTTGNPASLLKVRWFLDGQLMKEFPECNYTSYDENGIGEGNGGPFCGLDPSILSLEKVDETFSGKYTCQGKNVAGWGRESEPKELIVYYPPSPAKLRFYPSTVVKGASVTLECTVDNPGRPDNVTYIWYRGSAIMDEITSSNYTIAPVRLETRSNFTCTAVNEGGHSVNATVFINVNAPPSFIQKLPTYQGVLYSSQHINLTCIVECYPVCSIVWKKDGVKIDTRHNPLYKVETIVNAPDLRKNDFESINSTLIWNIDAWPGKKLNKTAPNSNYTCQSMANIIGSGVSSTIEIAVDYPPEDLVVSSKLVYVVENQAPYPVKCHGKGHPAPTYQWKKNATSEPISNNEELVLGPMTRSDSGVYICEATNKHGTETAIVIFNVQYAPECSIDRIQKDSSPALLCSVDANPQDVTFVWRAKESNETFTVSSNIMQEGLKSYLILDSSVDITRTYYCFANNSVGAGIACERDVPGNLPWWKHLNKDQLLIIIASIIAIIIIVLIICIIIILLCRRKRADTKYNNPLEMEERENPDGHCSIISDQSKWPLQPGVLVHVNKMNGISISQLSSRVSPFKTTSVSSRYLKYKRNKSKVYARLERLKELLGIDKGPHHVPVGIKESDGGVVTFKKINPNVGATRPEIINSRKRKKPGSAPNPYSTEDKAKLGAAPPVGGTVDPLSDPDKGFYENLPFHGMQNPPNKPISIIAPFNPGNNAHSFTSSTKSLLSKNQSTLAPFGSLSTDTIQSKTIKRHQSFHGFQKSQTPLTNLPPYFPLSGNVNNAYLNSYASQHFQNVSGVYNPHVPNRFIPSIFSQLPPNFGNTPGYNTIAGIPLPNNRTNFHKVQNVVTFDNKSSQQINVNPFISYPSTTSLSQPNRVIGRNENHYDIRRTASGINPPRNDTQVNKPSAKKHVSNKKHSANTEKRFSSLDIKKHKCYSPTFYSVRSKKHAKRRPIVQAVAEKYFSELEAPQNITTDTDTSDKKEDFQNLTDSIQIFEQNSENAENDGDITPTPAPRCRRYKKSEIVYANVSPCINTSNSNSEDSNSSTETIKNNPNEATVTEVQVHVPNDSNKVNDENLDVIDGTDESNKENLDANEFNKLGNVNKGTIISKNLTNKSDCSPKLVAVSPKQIQAKIILSPHALKNSPTLKVSPNFVKPKTESPKGALSLQIKAKIKASPAHSPSDNPNKTIISELKTEEKATESFPDIPQMPILNTQIKWSPNTANSSNQNAFYTLTTPHFKQLNTVVPPQYSATIPHQKHVKLIPKALFQEQLSKSKSFSSKSKQKKHHFQIPLQKCHSFKFQTAESYFQPIKNIHEENLMRNGYVTDYPESSHRGRHHKREKPKQITKGPLVLRRPSDYQENMHFQENMQNSVQLQYPQPMLGRNIKNSATNKPNGVVYADLDMSTSNNTKSLFDVDSSKTKSQKSKPKTEYATLKFNDVGQEIDV